MSNVPLKRKTATRVFSDADGSMNVKYHATVVVRFNDKEIELNSGRWHTVTTKARMNQASSEFGLGFSVFQNKFDWFVTYRGETVPFKDGMVLTR